ncbi:hydroxyethylthiazole kinase [Rubellimicrobium sp. CFH 75288]|uniref:hydroxyethylthiazole kinase n=1 Tax=Rubellimicrobium sp. CFH 75288 TaxID=2697034 RepID=UPI001411C9C5|nr:hydroxyethylthiazole kinase [Rubellimicrobium sp. CFH 75288]NAZ35717.1 hydroxyethylthiazole kinase [Rubellimicrobium sp. CFH 75288]
MTEPGPYLDRMRQTVPLVHNITNFVAMNVMANVLLAAGASPAMVHAREEAAEFAALAQTLTVNIGTADPAWGSAMEEAAGTMNRLGRPWVLDPVGVAATRFRRDLAGRLVALRPTVVRGNASEIRALAGLTGSARGVDAGDSVEAATDAARALAEQTGGIVAVSGPVDFVTDGRAGYRVANGHALMARVTALGCSLNGVIGAFCAGQSPLEATVAALAFYGAAGEEAAGRAAGPGSFLPAFLDALAAQTPEGLDAAARVERA